MEAKMDAKMDALSLDVNQVKLNKPGLKGYTTTAQLWQRGLQDHTISPHDNEFSSYLLNKVTSQPIWLTEGVVPDTLRTFVAPIGSSEKDTLAKDKTTVIAEGTQSHFSRAMRKILDNINEHQWKRPQESGYSTTFHHRHKSQQRYNSKGDVYKVYSVPNGEAFRTASFLLRKPDIVFYDHHTLRSTRRITMFGDLKGHYGDYFTDSDKGEILDFGMDLLIYIQPERPFIVVFLTNTRGFQFFKIERDPTGGFQTKESEYYDGVEVDQLGWQVSVHQYCCSTFGTLQPVYFWYI